MPSLSLSWRMLMRDLKAGELWLLAFALILAVASLTSVGFFTDRLGRALQREANQLLGGDLMLTADHAWAPSFADVAGGHKLALVRSTIFASMAAKGDAAQMASIKAVESGFPLRGSLRIADGLNQPDRKAQSVPAPGTVWLDERLAAALHAEVGQRILLGQTQPKVAAILSFDGERGGNFLSLAPRLIMNLADLPRTGLIRLGSRASYRLHLAGEEADVAAYQAWAKPRLGRGEQLEDIANARPEMRTALDRAQRYLGLSALLAVVLAAVAVGLSARRFMQRHIDGCAVMRALGAGRRQVLGLYLSEFLMLGLSAVGLGALLGYGAQAALAWWLAELIGVPLPWPSLQPLVQGVAVGLVLLIGFVAPQLIRLGQVPPLRVLRRDALWTASFDGWGGWAAGALALGLLMLWMAGDVKLGLVVLLGFAAAAGLYALLARLLLPLPGRFWGGGSGWRYGLVALRRRANSAAIQAMALGLGLTALLVLGLARQDLLDSWRSMVPADAPNRFIINIQPEERQAIQDFYRHSHLPVPELLPMVRGRLTAINERPVSAADYQEERAQRLVEREFNLSWGEQLPAHNSLAAGHWFHGDGAGEFSVEQALAQTLGLKLGDRLRFEVAGQSVDAPVTSLRKLNWDSMKVNFFVIAPSATLKDFPASYITSFHLPKNQAAFTARLVQAFPTLTVIDISAMLQQLEDAMTQLGRAVQLVFGFALAGGLLVMGAAIQSTHDERQRELAVLRVLGAQQRQLQQALAAEFLVLGLVAGFLAGLGAAAITWGLAVQVFKLPYVPGLMPIVLGMAVGLGLTLAAGLTGTRRTLRVSPLLVLRERA